MRPGYWRPTLVHREHEPSDVSKLVASILPPPLTPDELAALIRDVRLKLSGTPTAS